MDTDEARAREDAAGNTPAPLLTIIGPRGSAHGYAIRDFLHRSDVPFKWIEVRDDTEARAKALVPRGEASRLPVCLFPDGTLMECPTIRQITEKLGWFRNPSRTEYEVAIYGAGPAGLSAAVYAASDGLKTVLVERWAVGGQAGSSSRIEAIIDATGTTPRVVFWRDLSNLGRGYALETFGIELDP